jgi:predicted secreted protein
MSAYLREGCLSSAIYGLKNKRTIEKKSRRNLRPTQKERIGLEENPAAKTVWKLKLNEIKSLLEEEACCVCC